MRKIALFLGCLSAVIFIPQIAFSGAKLQQQDFKTAAQCIASGASVANCLLLDQQIYVTAKGLNEQLSTAITNGDIGGGGTPGGSDTQVQFNNSGAFGGSASLTWNGLTLTSSQYIDSGLTASSPVYANSSKQLSSGTFSGNTTIFATASGALTSGHCVQIDASGNFVDAGAACGTGSSLTFPDSVIDTAGAVTLSGDSASPGNSQYYGTNASGTKGWNALSFSNVTGTATSAQVPLAATATALAAAGTTCSSGQVPTGVDASGNAVGCAAPQIAAQNQSGTQVLSPNTITVPNNQLTGNGIGSALIETGNKNLLANPSFEASTTNVDWTAGTGVSQATDSSNFHDGLKSIKLTLASVTSGTIAYYQSVTPSATLSQTNGEAGLWVDTTAANLQVCALAAGAVVSGTCNNVPSSGNWVYVPANFVFPSSGSSGVGLYASAAIASGTVNVDEGYLGEARNIGTVAQAQLWGQVQLTGCSAPYNYTSASMSAPSNAPTGCAATVTSGLAGGCTWSSGPSIKCSSVPPGNYTIKVEGTLQGQWNSGASTLGATLQLYDGTNYAKEVSDIANVNSSADFAVTPGIQQTFTYTTSQSNTTWSLQGAGSSGAQANVFATAASPLVISVYYYPTQSQTVASLASVSANASYTSTLSGTTTSASFADPGSVTGAITASGTPHNITCSKDATLLGIDCTLPKTGNYLVCDAGYASNGTNGYFSYAQLVDGSGTVIAGQTGGMNTSGIGECGQYTASSTSVAFKVQGKIAPGGTATIAPTSFSITQIDSPGPQPYATGNISSTGAGQYHNDIVTGTCSTSSAIGFNTFGTAPTISNISSGCCTITLPGTEFSATPGPNSSANSNTAPTYSVGSNCSSTTSCTVCGSAGGTSSYDFNLTLLGPH